MIAVRNYNMMMYDDNNILYYIIANVTINIMAICDATNKDKISIDMETYAERVENKI